MISITIDKLLRKHWNGSEINIYILSLFNNLKYKSRIILSEFYFKLPRIALSG